MSLVDSRAVFTKRMNDLGIGDLAAAFEAYGWVTYGSFSFAVTYSPTLPDSAIVDGILKKLTMDETLWPTIRRLHFEAYTITMGELRSRSSLVEQENTPRTMPPPEKADRFEALKRAYPSFVFDEMVEPSDTLVDKFHTMKERGVLKYLAWQEYGQRDAELENDKQEVVFKPDKQGVLRSSVDSVDPAETDVSSTFKLEKALYRRGAAMHMAALLTFEQHEKLIKHYFKEHLADPLPGYGRISLEQIARTDKEIFRRMAEETRAGLGLTASGKYPLYEVLERVRAEPRIVVLMMPLPATKSVPTAEATQPKRNSDAAELNRLREEVKRLRTNASSSARNVQQAVPK